MSGQYTVTVDMNGRHVLVTPEEASLNADGQGVIYVNGPRQSIGKPCVYPCADLLAENALPMAEVEDGLYQCTFEVGSQMADSGIDFAVYPSTGVDTLFTATGSVYKMTYQTSTQTVYFNMGTGKLGHTDGHIYQRTAAKLTEGTCYQVFVDLRSGLKAGKVYVQKYDESADGISASAEVYPLQGNDAVYDLSGRRVSNPGQKGVYIINGKKYLK